MSIDDTSILNISSTQEKNKLTKFLENINVEEPDLNPFLESIIDINLNEYISDVVTYIAGYIQRSVLLNLKCDECRESILNCESESCNLIDIKNFGGLVKPSTIIKKICVEAEKTFRTSSDQNAGDIEHLIRSAFRYLDLKMFSSMNDHFINSDPIENHRLIFVKIILHEYFKVRIHHKNVMTLEKNTKSKIRNFYKKLIHFKGQ